MTVGTQPLLAIRDLKVRFRTAAGEIDAVDGMSLDAQSGEITALVGESGSGKTVTALSVMRLLPKATSTIVGGAILLEGENLLSLSEAEMRRVRGRRIGMIFQEPMTSLNPVMTIGRQLMEPIGVHLRLGRRAAKERALELLNLVGVSDPRQRLADYPHRLSGGMRQRIMIAIALSCEPRLILADEPTTALDVTIQAQVLELIASITHRLGTAVILITHNLGIVARYADQVHVMYAGRPAESAPAKLLYREPRHPYTVGLLDSVPRLDRARGDILVGIEGMPPDIVHRPAGCAFAPRCPYVRSRCTAEQPPLINVADGHLSACWEWRALVERGMSASGI